VPGVKVGTGNGGQAYFRRGKASWGRKAPDLVRVNVATLRRLPDDAVEN